MNVLLATAAMMVASTAVSAQTMKAEIPFAFRAGGVDMAPGSYYVTASNAESRFQLREANGSRHVLLMPAIRQDAPKEWQKAGSGILEFKCGEEGCALRRVWTGNRGLPARGFNLPKGNEGDSGEMAVIRLIPGIAR